MTRDTFIGLGAALSANVIFGLNIPVTKILVAHWMTPLGYTATRMLFGAVVFWAIASIWNREKVARKDLITVLIGGLLGYLGTQFFYSLKKGLATLLVLSGGYLVSVNRPERLGKTPQGFEKGNRIWEHEH